MCQLVTQCFRRSVSLYILLVFFSQKLSIVTIYQLFQHTHSNFQKFCLVVQDNWENGKLMASQGIIRYHSIVVRGLRLLVIGQTYSYVKLYQLYVNVIESTKMTLRFVISVFLCYPNLFAYRISFQTSNIVLIYCILEV